MKQFLVNFVLALAVVSSLAFAQSIDKVIVVSDITTVDFHIAKAAGDKAGMPVLIALNGEITEELKLQLADLKPKLVILIGGPVVINPEAEAQLTSLGYNVVRLWGVERTGTAAEVGKFFWREGAACVVVVEDTRNTGADTRLQSIASNLAAHKGCALMPVPAGTVPAGVLATLQELGVRNVYFLGKELKIEIKEKLKQFVVEEKVGDDNDVEHEIEEEIINGTPRFILKLVIVAAPNWKDVHATGGIPSENSVVRIVNNADNLSEIIELITSRNISDVRVVGSPELAQQIADQLNASGIAVRKISGKPDDVSHKAIKEFMFKWREKIGNENSNEFYNRERIRARLLLVINETENQLDEQWVLLEKLAAEGADLDSIAVLKEAISLAKSRLGEVRTKIQNGDFDGAEKLRLELKNNFEKGKFRLRLEIKYRLLDDIEEEEDEIEKFELKIDVRDVEGKFGEFRQRCTNITAIEALVEKAKSLKEAMETAKQEGNYTKAAEIAREAHDIAEQARALGNLCEKRGEISEKLQKIAEEQVERAEKLREKIEKKFEVDFVNLPSSAAVNQSFSISWKVQSFTTTQITHTAVHYDYASHPGEFGFDIGPAQSGYPLLTQEYKSGSFNIPDTFTASITGDKEGVLYLRAHAIIGGKNYWAEEKELEIRSSSGSGGGMQQITVSYRTFQKSSIKTIW